MARARQMVLASSSQQPGHDKYHFGMETKHYSSRSCNICLETMGTVSLTSMEQGSKWSSSERLRTLANRIGKLKNGPSGYFLKLRTMLQSEKCKRRLPERCFNRGADENSVMQLNMGEGKSSVSGLRFSPVLPLKHGLALGNHTPRGSRCSRWSEIGSSGRFKAIEHSHVPHFSREALLSLQPPNLLPSIFAIC